MSQKGFNPFFSRHWHCQSFCFNIFLFKMTNDAPTQGILYKNVAEEKRCSRSSGPRKSSMFTYVEHPRTFGFAAKLSETYTRTLIN